MEGGGCGVRTGGAWGGGGIFEAPLPTPARYCHCIKAEVTPFRFLFVSMTGSLKWRQSFLY